MNDNTDNSSASNQEIPKEKGILIIDRLLSAGWTSTLDMSIALYEYACKNDYESSRAPSGLSIVDFYNWLMENGGLFSGRIRSSYFYFMSEIWTLVHEGTADSKKKDQFIESVQVTRKNEADYELSEDTLSYLHHGRGVRSLWIFTYKDSGFSIVEDLRRYKDLEKWRSSKTDYKKIEDSVKYNPAEALEKYNLVPDPDVIGRKCKALFIQELQRALLADTEGNVRRRLETVERLKKSKPVGWMESASNTYLNAIYDGLGIMKDIDIAPVLHHYGSHLIDRKEYLQGQRFLRDSLNTLREVALSGNDLAKEEYALTLQNLSTLHVNLGEFELAEEEALESLKIYRELSASSDSYRYGVALLLHTLAEIHVELKKLDTVEDEYDEAARIFSDLSDEEPTKYLYMLVECISSLAKYYYIVRRIDDSIEAFERAMPFWDKLTEKNFDDFAPNKVNTMINYALSLGDNGSKDDAETLLNEAIDIAERLNNRSPNVYNEELSTAYQNRGALYAEKGDFEKAEQDLLMAEHLRRDLAALDANAFNNRLATTLDSLANLDLIGGNSYGAIARWKEAISLLEIYDDNGSNGFTSAMGQYCSSIGMAFLNLGENENALNYLTKAESCFRIVFDRNSSPQMFEDKYALTLSYLGFLYGANQDTQTKAEDLFEESLDVAHWFNACAHSNDYSYLVLVCCNYAPFLFNQGRYEEAKQMWEQAVMFGEKKSPRLFAEQEQQLLDLARENILEAEYRIEHPEDEYQDNDEASREDDSSDGETSNGIAFGNYSPEDAMKAIQSTAEEIANLNKEDIHYRSICNELYKNSLKYCASAPNSLYLADYLTSMCQFLAEGYSFSIVLDIAPIAKNIYEDILGEDNANMAVRLKYIELLSSYCRALDEYNHDDELYKIIESAYNLLAPIDIDEGDDIGGTYAALKNELLYDYIFRGNQEEQYEQAKYILTFYRRVSSPSKSAMCRFLTKAAISACELEKYEEVGNLIEETETLTRECDLDDMANCLSLGQFYTFKGKFLRYLYHDVEKTFEAFDQAQALLEKGLDYNPAAFKCELLTLFHSRLEFLNIFFTMYEKEEQDLIKKMFALIEDLTGINDYIFTWRSVDAYFEIVKVLRHIYFSNFYNNSISLEELEKYCANALSMYSEMESMLTIYRKACQSLYSDYISKVYEEKKELKNDLRAAEE